MPSVLSHVVYGEKKNIALKSYNVGSLVKAVTFDLEEFGKRGVQGLAIKTTDADKMIKYESANKNLKEPYLMAGVCKKDLVLVVRDAKDPKFEAMAVLVKGYADIKEKLAASSSAVVNLDEGDDAVDESSAALADKRGTAVQGKDDADFGNVTGDVALCAHGDPQTSAGRVIGVKLGEMTPKEVADLLTRNKDKSRALARNYSGKITLVGCFTASGGPEALKKDDPFAKKVWDELKARGFDKCSVVGMPGVATVAQATRKDDGGTGMKRGDTAVWAKSEEQLEAYSKQSQKIRGEIDDMVDKLVKAGKAQKGDKAAFLASEPAKKVLAAINDKEKALESIRKEMESIQADVAKYGDVDGKLLAHVTGTFGLRVVKKELLG
jgi:hypothetical protein